MPQSPATAPSASTLLVRELREFLATTPDTKVDRTSCPTHCIIAGVKLLSSSSPNTHGVDGVDGTVYTPEAAESGRLLYEGAKVNVNHPPRDDPNQERSAYDRAGMVVNVRTVEGESFGDLYLLRSHPITAPVCDAAESKTLASCFALSHNALGEGSVKGGKYVVSKIVECRSVDIVADGGTNKSLFESKERKPMPETPPAAKKVKLKSLIEAVKDADRKKALLPLLEWDDGAYGGMDVTEAPVEEEADWKDDLVQAIGKLVQEDDPAAHELAQKIMAMLKPDNGEAETQESEEDEDDDQKPTQESRELKRKMARLEVKDHCRDLCEAAEFRPTAVQLKSLVALSSDAERQELIESLKATSKPKARSTPPGAPRQQPLQENKAPTKPEERMALLN
jgi:hypothetical protein